MATSFPAGLDSFTNPTSADSLNTAGVVHHEQHADVNDAVEALQAKVGVTGSAITSTLDYKVAQLEAGKSHAFIGVKAYSSVVVPVGHATFTAVAFDSERLDTHGFHDNVTNNSRVTIPAGLAGKYRVTVRLDYAASGAGIRVARIYHNGSVVTAAQSANAGSAYTVGVEVSDVLTLAVGDYVQAFAYQDSGGSINVTNGFQWSYLIVEYLGV